MYLRGRIVSHYAHAEFFLSDFISKCQLLPEYRKESFKLPYRLESKLNAVRRIACADGPLKKYEIKLCSLIDEIRKFEETRHFMAHGFMMLKYNNSGHLIEFRLYTYNKDHEPKLEFMNFTIEEMRQISEPVAKFNSNMMGLFRDIYLTEKLEK